MFEDSRIQSPSKRVSFAGPGSKKVPGNNHPATARTRGFGVVNSARNNASSVDPAHHVGLADFWSVVFSSGL